MPRMTPAAPADDLDSANSQATTDAAENEAQPELTPAEIERRWKARYDGLFGTANKYKKQADKLTLEFSELQQQYEDLKLASSGELERLRKEHEAATRESAAATARAAALEKRSAIGLRVAQEFPSLSGLFQKGLLVGAESMEDDKLAEYLTNLSEELNGMTEKRVTKAAAGSTPPAAPASERSTAGMTREQAVSILQDATRQYGYNSQEYREAYQQYVRVIEGSAAKS